jgi:hypothetical protein
MTATLLRLRSTETRAKTNTTRRTWHRRPEGTFGQFDPITAVQIEVEHELEQKWNVRFEDLTSSGQAGRRIFESMARLEFGQDGAALEDFSQSTHVSGLQSVDFEKIAIADMETVKWDALAKGDKANELVFRGIVLLVGTAASKRVEHG